MPFNIDDGLIVTKTRELCETILREPAFDDCRRSVDAFLTDDAARALYQELNEKGEALQHKQQNGQPLSDAEVDEFERRREEFFRNPVARGFVEARQQMNQVQEKVTHYVNKTFELGRLPEPEDFSSCGHGCNCHH